MKLNNIVLHYFLVLTPLFPAYAESVTADLLLQKIIGFYRQAETVSVTVEQEMSFSIGDEAHEISQQANFNFKRPSLVRMEVSSSFQNFTASNSRNESTVYLVDINQYLRGAALDFHDLDAIEHNDAAQMFVGSLMAYPLCGLIVSGMFPDQLEVISELSLEEVEYAGSEAYRLSFTYQMYHAKLWLPKSGDLRIQRLDLVIDIAEAGQAPGGMQSVELKARYKNWKIDEVIEDSVFELDLPEDAQPFDTTAASSEASNPAAYALLGEAAPEVTLKLLDGRELELSSHVGEDIVVLDFWATWCPPCIRALPELEKVEQEYQEKGVVVYGLNQGESDSTIRKFVDKRDLTLNMALDNGVIGRLFEVSAIPQTVIVGKDGRIHSIHVGYSSNYLDEVRSDIEALLAGEDLAAQKIAALKAGADRESLENVYQAAAIPVGPDTSTWQTVQELSNTVLRRQLLKEIREQPPQAVGGVQAISDFITEYTKQARVVHLVQQKYLQASPQLTKRLLTEVRALKEQYGELPVLLFCELDLMLQSRKTGQVVMKCAGLGYERSIELGSNPYFAFTFAKVLATWGANEARKKKFLEKLPALAVGMVESKHYQPGEEREAMLRLHEYWDLLDDSELRGVVEHLVASGDVLECVLDYADGAAHIREGWSARGGGWAASVTEDGWEQFHHHLAEARKSLTACWERHPELPEAAHKMIGVAMASSEVPNEMRLWFDRSVSAQMDYLPAYKSLEWGLLPRWGGSHRTMMQFAQECLATNRYDTAVPLRYFYVIRAISRDTKDFAIFKHEATRVATNQLIDGYMEGDNSILKASKQAVHLFAAQSVYVGDFEKGHKLLDSIKYAPSGADEDLFDGVFGRESHTYISLAAIYGSDLADDVRQAGALMQAGDFAGALAVYNRLLLREKLNREQKSFLLEAVALAETREKQSTGEWVTIHSDETATAWAGEDLLWTRDAEGRLYANRASHWLWLPVELDFKRGFEMEVELERVGQARNTYLAKFFIGDPSWFQHEHLTIWLRPKNKSLWIYPISDDKIELELNDTNSFKLFIKVTDMKLSMYVNGEPLLADHKLVATPRYEHPLRLGMGDSWYGLLRKNTRIKGLRLRSGE